jgi:DNA-binding MarR family transcriptional regulator
MTPLRLKCGGRGGRGVLVSTTTKGRRLGQRAQEQRLRNFAEALEHLGDDLPVAMRPRASQLERFTLVLEHKTGS